MSKSVKSNKHRSHAKKTKRTKKVKRTHTKRSKRMSAMNCNCPCATCLRPRDLSKKMSSKCRCPCLGCKVASKRFGSRNMKRFAKRRFGSKNFARSFGRSFPGAIRRFRRFGDDVSQQPLAVVPQFGPGFDGQTSYGTSAVGSPYYGNQEPFGIPSQWWIPFTNGAAQLPSMLEQWQ